MTHQCWFIVSFGVEGLRDTNLQFRCACDDDEKNTSEDSSGRCLYPGVNVSRINFVLRHGASSIPSSILFAFWDKLHFLANLSTASIKHYMLHHIVQNM